MPCKDHQRQMNRAFSNFHFKITCVREREERGFVRSQSNMPTCDFVQLASVSKLQYLSGFLSKINDAGSFMISFKVKLSGKHLSLRVAVIKAERPVRIKALNLVPQEKTPIYANSSSHWQTYKLCFQQHKQAESIQQKTKQLSFLSGGPRKWAVVRSRKKHVGTKQKKA